MSTIVCSICGEGLDEDNADLCLNCGRIFCSKESESESGFCKDCLEKGPYSGC